MADDQTPADTRPADRARANPAPVEQKPAGFEDIMGGVPAGQAQPGAEASPMSSPELKSLLGIVTAVVVIAALYFGADVLIPITLAVMLSFVLSPLVKLL